MDVSHKTGSLIYYSHPYLFIENLNDFIPSDKKSRFVYLEPKAAPAKSKLLKNFIL